MPSQLGGKWLRCSPSHHVGTGSDLTVQSEEDEHHEEEAGPERRQGHHGDCLRVGNEGEPGTCVTHSSSTVTIHTTLRDLS